MLPPSFLAHVLGALQPGSLGVAVVRATAGMLGARHAAEALQNCWHGGGLRLEQVKGQMKALLKARAPPFRFPPPAFRFPPAFRCPPRPPARLLPAHVRPPARSSSPNPSSRAPQEFVASGDVGEAERLLAALNVPHFHHEARAAPRSLARSLLARRRCRGVTG